MQSNTWKSKALVAALVALAPLSVPSDAARADGLVPGASITSLAPAASTEAWVPMRALIGNWSGVQTASDAAGKAVKVSRKFETGLNSKHLELNEKAGDTPWGVAGVISYDAERGGLVLRRFAADGKTTDLAYDEAGSSETKLVFAGIADNPGRTRVTYERASWNEFTERVEYAPQGAAGYTLVSETKFKRKG